MLSQIASTFKKYKQIGGRSSRTEFWWFYLFTSIIAVALMLIGPLVSSQRISLPILALILLLSFIILLPSITLTVRRLHDIGSSGWHTL
jgi:uncharacterized membrane protein YhaH (DUF805 family)